MSKYYLYFSKSYGELGKGFDRSKIDSSRYKSMVDRIRKSNRPDDKKRIEKGKALLSKFKTRYGH